MLSYNISITLFLLSLVVSLPAVAHAPISSDSSDIIAGPILPGTDPTPVNPCPTDTKLVLLNFGSNSYETSRFPHVVLATSKGPELVLDRSPDRGLFVTANFTNIDGRSVATLDRNTFAVFMKSSPKLSIPDHHSLVVTASDGTIILDVRYLNPNAIVLEGHMILSGIDVVATAKKTTINQSDVTLADNCVIDSTGSDLFLGNP